MTDLKEVVRLLTDTAGLFPGLRALLETGEDANMPAAMVLLDAADQRMGELDDAVRRLTEGMAS